MLIRDPQGRRHPRQHWRFLLALLLIVSHVVMVSDFATAAALNLKDKFNAQAYGNNDGSQSWLGNWEEVGESTSPTSGTWQVAKDGDLPAYSLRKTGLRDTGIQREADLTSFTSANLKFDYRRQALTPAHSVEVQVSSHGLGGPWVTVATIDGGPDDATDPAYLSRSIDITKHISSTTAIRFYHPVTSGSFGKPHALFLDNIAIVGNSEPVSDPIGDQPDVDGAPIGGSAPGPDPDFVAGLIFAKPDTVSLTEDGSATFDPLSNDFDPDGDALSVAIMGEPGVGAITVEASGSFLFRPPDNVAGMTSTVYTIEDGSGSADSATITFLVIGVNDPPIGASDVIVLTSYLPQMLFVLANDTDIDDDLLEIAPVEQPPNGEVTLNSYAIKFFPQPG